MGIRAMALTLSLALGLSGLGFDQPSMAKSKKWTITQRQEALLKEINRSQKANELTLAEADGLRKHLDKINVRIEKLKARNAGKLSYDDIRDIERSLNKVSIDMTKKQLKKRVEE